MGKPSGIIKLRKKHPLLGYALMTSSLMPWLKNSVYAFTALDPNYSTALSGHDWANYAKNTGIHPIIPATIITASLPLLAISLWMLEKLEEKYKQETLKKQIGFIKSYLFWTNTQRKPYKRFWKL